MHVFCALLVCFVAMATSHYARAQFDGNLELIPSGCQASGQCTLKSALRFTDNAKVVWEAKAGLITDGASIPGIFQPFVGKPFEESFVKAAVIHDHYCDRHVRPWRQTHRVFYEGLVDQGVAKAKAKIMYFAVFLGGPKWVELIPSNNCGPNCVNAIKTLSGVSGVWARKADYSGADLHAAVKDLSTELDRAPDSLSLDQLDARAESLRPSDFYFAHGDKVNASELGIVE